MIIAEYFKGLIDILIPKACILCGRETKDPCGVCELCRDFKKSSSGISPFIFTSPLSELIHLFKYKGFVRLAGLFSGHLIEFLRNSGFSAQNYDFITYVPLHPRKLREREYNQSRILAKGVAEYFNLPLKDTLAVKRYLKPQISKNYQERLEELKNNFYVKTALAEKRIVLIDDVFTTGSTISECAKVLKQAGAEKILTVTLAIAASS